MTEPRIPDWLLADDAIEPPKGGGAFLRKTASALSGVIRSVRRVPENSGRFAFSPPTRLALAVVTILLVSASSVFMFVEIVGVALLALLATFDARRLARTLALPLEAYLAALVILAPALIWGQTRAFVVVSTKTLITTLTKKMAEDLTDHLIQSMNWNRFPCAFKSFGAPDAVVFIFDLTLKYVVVFGETCLETLDSALIRLIGRDKTPGRTFGGIVGTLFLRSQSAAQDQFDAMTCRCFSGVYRRYRAPFRRADFVGILIIVALVALFVYFEIAKRCLN